MTNTTYLEWKDMQTVRQTDGRTERERETDRHRGTDRQRERQADRQWIHLDASTSRVTRHTGCMYANTLNHKTVLQGIRIRGV